MLYMAMWCWLDSACWALNLKWKMHSFSPASMYCTAGWSSGYLRAPIKDALSVHPTPAHTHIKSSFKLHGTQKESPHCLKKEKSGKCCNYDGHSTSIRIFSVTYWIQDTPLQDHFKSLFNSVNQIFTVIWIWWLLKSIRNQNKNWAQQSKAFFDW